MALSHKSKYFISLLMAFNLTALATTPAAYASTGGRYYQVELNESAKKDEKIIRGAMIRCTDTYCRGKKAKSPPVNMCARIARTFGPITSFSAGDKVFDEAAIAKCNEKA